MFTVQSGRMLSQAKSTKTIYTKSSQKASPQKQQTTHSGDVLKKRRDKGSTILVQLKKNQKDWNTITYM